MFYCSNQLHSVGVTNVLTMCQYSTEQMVGTEAHCTDAIIYYFYIVLLPFYMSYYFYK